jgi:glycosyltransferase involved in cell wall biosynthesis
VPLDAFDTSRVEDLRRAWGAAPPAKVVACVGQIAPWKRVHDVVTAFQSVAAELSSARLVIVGAAKFRPENHDYLRRLHRQVSECGLGGRVVFTGHQDDIDRVFRSIDVLVHAAEREPFGRVLVEAMAHRVPVVAAADGGIPEIVRDGETGFLVPSRNTEVMSARVLGLLRDDDLRRRMGERGRARAFECFRTDRGARDLVEVYRAVLQSSE